MDWVFEKDQKGDGVQIKRIKRTDYQGMEVGKQAAFSGNHEWEKPTMSLEVWLGVS